MIAVDTNILVYVHRQDSPWHETAYARLAELAEGRAAWAIPWPCLHEFLAMVTHPQIYNPLSPLETATAQVEAWLEAPGLVRRIPWCVEGAREPCAWGRILALI